MVTNTDLQQLINEKINEARKRNWRPRGWIKLEVKGWLHGSINARLNPAQLGVFSKLLAMADAFGRVPGLISDNDFRPLSREFLAHEAFCSVELLEETITLCKEEGSIYENSHGLFMVHFDDYQFTEYDRQKPYREAKKEREGKKTHKFCPSCGYKAFTDERYCPVCAEKDQGILLEKDYKAGKYSHMVQR